jgi:hypothetical protein
VATAQGKLIDVRGLQQTNRLLREVSPDLRKQMFRDIGHLVKVRVTAARDSMPTRSGRMRKETFLTKAGSKKSQAAGGGSRKQGLFGFQAVSAAPYATIWDLMAKASRPSAVTLLSRIGQDYGPAPRFLGRQFLPSGEGGTKMWRESRDIVEKYITEANKLIDQAATVRIAG